MKIIAIANQKGGVGKTTTAASLSAELAISGYKTLIIDADPQANATKMFLRENEVTTSLSEVLLNSPKEPTSGIAEKRLTTALEGLDIVPATITLANFDREPPLSIKKLRSTLKEVEKDYDFTIIDTPPNFGLLLSAALIASDYVVIPVQAAPFALSGLDDLLTVIEDSRQLNEKLEILGAVCTRYDARTKISKESLSKLHDKSRVRDFHVFETIINQDTKLEASPDANQPIQLFAPESRGADEYSKLGGEILERLNFSVEKGNLKLIKDNIANG
jgi:chromosome partitioning protein